MRENCRLGDTACRFGGEEFTVLLTDTDESTAREWGNRLRRSLRDMKVSVDGQLLPSVTVSLGLALYPVHGNDKETLLKAADVALYDAKRAGQKKPLDPARHLQSFPKPRWAKKCINTPGGRPAQAEAYWMIGCSWVIF